MKNLIQQLPRTCTLLTAFALPFIAFGEWTLLEDFEDGNADGWFFSQRLSIQPQNTEEHDGWHEVMERPYDDEGGMVLGASEGTSWYNVYDAVLPLENMSETEDYTLYFEVAYPDDSASINMCVGDMLVPDAWSDTEPEWADYSMLARFGRPGLNVRDVNGTGYAEPYGEQELQTWYRVWMVVHPQFYSWSMWVQGGAFEEQTQVADYHYWRKNDTDGVGPMRAFAMRLTGNSSSETSTGSPTYLDNLYLDRDGQNLEEPDGGTTVPMWGDYELVEGWAGTETFMGWLYPIGDYVYSESLGKYVYLPAGNMTGGGAWVYCPGGYDETGMLESGWLESDVLGWVRLGEGNYTYSQSLEKYIYLGSRDTTDLGKWVYVGM